MSEENLAKNGLIVKEIKISGGKSFLAVSEPSYNTMTGNEFQLSMALSC